MRRRPIKSVVKGISLTDERAIETDRLEYSYEVGGIYGVAVKCIDTIKNTDSEGSLLD